MGDLSAAIVIDLNTRLRTGRRRAGKDKRKSSYPLPEPTLSAASGLIGRRGREHPSYARRLAGLFPLSPSALPSLRFGAVETTPVLASGAERTR